MIEMSIVNLQFVSSLVQIGSLQRDKSYVANHVMQTEVAFEICIVSRHSMSTMSSPMYTCTHHCIICSSYYLELCT